MKTPEEMGNMPERKEGKIELTPKEIEIIGPPLQEMIENVKETISRRLGELEEEGKKEGIGFERVLEGIASQEGWDGRSYGGVHPSSLHLPGGFSESALSNLVYDLGAEFSGRIPGSKAFAIVALRRVVQQDNKLRSLIGAVVTATKKVGAEYVDSTSSHPRGGKKENLERALKEELDIGELLLS